MGIGCKYQAHLQRGGIGLQEMQQLLRAYAEHGDWGKVRELVVREGFLGKTSDYTAKAMLRAFKRRFLSDLGLPPVDLVARMMCSDIPRPAKVQTLLPYYLLSDRLVLHCYRELVLKRLGSERPALTTSEVREHLEALSTEHEELGRWSDYLRRRWARAFITFLRHFGLMERHPHNELRRLWLSPETFGFFWLWFWERDGSFWSVKEKELWILLQLDGRRCEELLCEGQLRGWWVYQRSGDMVQFRPIFNNLEEWLQNGLA
ncbi:BrxA family protein [Candidatus Bipolaricaulota sp. J31]